MIYRRHTLDVQEVRNRAAEIRRNWSPLEKLRRTGLPPDLPAKLRALILRSSKSGFNNAIADRPCKSFHAPCPHRAAP
jgi:hypothetical protein